MSRKPARSRASCLSSALAVCCNWFPITCAYRWGDEIKEEPEIVLLVKTQAGRRAAVEQAVASVVSYVNCIAEIAPEFGQRRFSRLARPRRASRSTRLVRTSHRARLPVAMEWSAIDALECAAYEIGLTRA